MENPGTVDAMSLDNNRVGAIEQELLQQRDTLNTIQSQLSQLLVNAQVAPSTGGTLPNNSDTPSNGPMTTSINSRMKPAAPSEFDGSRSKGRAFLNSCELYIGLAPNQFPSDDSKVYWALSYMKGDRAARFTD